MYAKINYIFKDRLMAKGRKEGKEEGGERDEKEERGQRKKERKERNLFFISSYISSDRMLICGDRKLWFKFNSYFNDNLHWAT